MMRLTLAFLTGVLLFLTSSAADAYVWRCHTPTGDVWTDQPPQSSDCEEYDGIFNRSAVPPAQKSPPPQPSTPPPVVQAPAPAPPVYYPPSASYPYPYAYAYPYPYPAPYPYAYYPYYPGYYGPGVYFGFPGLFFDFRFGGRHIGHVGPPFHPHFGANVGPSSRLRGFRRH